MSDTTTDAMKYQSWHHITSSAHSKLPNVFVRTKFYAKNFLLNVFVQLTTQNATGSYLKQCVMNFEVLISCVYLGLCIILKQQPETK